MLKKYELLEATIGILTVRFVWVMICNHEMKLALTYLRYLRSEETVEEWIKIGKVLNDHAESESVLALTTLAFEIIDTVVAHRETDFENVKNFHFF